VLALLEFCSFFKEPDARPDLFLTLLNGIIFCLSAFFYGLKGFVLAFIIVFFLTLMRKFIAGNLFSFKSAALTVVASIYIGFSLSHLILIRGIAERGVQLVLAVILATWVFDTSAYFVGSLFGKTKLAPKISPHKTLEGAMGGLLITSIAAGSFCFIPFLNFIERILLGAGIAIFGQMGDLFESKLKRIAGLKDSGSLLPGHGGILDRFDSLILSAPAAFYLIKMLL
ncbi:phosphatidate cytidylyltransferase, partial [Candidatus Oleimmundimicrobium sp.]|uniref:phosphatidate cytidylyltransferase n=1 Tax=Candidatus Oleimmundimicrobium sp. TaxID=3060597 RepID=UPI00272365A9